MKYILRKIFFIALISSQSVFAGTAVLEDFSTSPSLQKFTNTVEQSITLDRVNQNLIIFQQGRSFFKDGTRKNLTVLETSDQNEDQSTTESRITKIQADLSVDEIILGSTTTQQMFIRIGGTFYNSSQGTVFAVIALGDRGNGLEAWYEITNNNGSGFTDNVDFQELDNLNLDPLSLNTAYAASLSYDGNNTFTFVFDNGEPLVIDGPAKIPAVTDFGDYQKFVGTRTRSGHDNSTPNDLKDTSQDNGSPLSIVARVDNVFVNDALFEDFSGTNLDDRWAGGEGSSKVNADGQLEMIASTQSTRQRTERIFIKKQGIKFLGAKATILSDSSTSTENTRVRARITDYLGNDTFDGASTEGEKGNIWTQLTLEARGDGVIRAFAYAAKVTDANFDEQDDLFFEVLPINIAFDTQYELVIEQIGSVVNYKIDGATLYTFDLANFPGLSGNVFPEQNNPSYQVESAVQARVERGAGVAHVLFDDITTDSMPASLSLNANNSDGEEIVLPDEVIVNEGEIVTLLAKSERPSDIILYVWEQTAGQDVTDNDVSAKSTKGNSLLSSKVVGSDSNTFSFVVPDGSDAQNLAFKVTAVDDAGLEAIQNFDVDVDNSQASTLSPVIEPTSSGGGSFNIFFIFMLLLAFTNKISLRSKQKSAV